jgi:GH15 family glucan-1,4-alpha-glucosidase
VLEHGWNADAGAFRQAYDNDRVDAANLLIPLVGFLDPHDPRARANLSRTRGELESDGVLRRFVSRPGELTEGEGAFVAASFWLVNALVQAGETTEAVAVFERLVPRAPLGLLSEEVDAASGALLGNVPQTLSHAALVSAAVNLARGAGVGCAPEADGAPPQTAHLVSIDQRAVRT